MKLQSLATEVLKSHREHFQSEPLICRAPGRVNIIGEHTDYNEGFVLPAAIDKASYVAVSKRDDDSIRLVSLNFHEEFETRLENLKPIPEGWANYVMGVADQLLKRGYKIGGFNLVLKGDVPIGAGLSSSASVECAVAWALNNIFQLNISNAELAEISQKAEHTFAGVMVGIMDLFISIHGRKDHVLKLDCRSLEYSYHPLELGDYKILLLNTNVKHSLASTEYNDRHAECRRGVEIVKSKYPEVRSLRDVTTDMLDELVKPVNELTWKRCSYVVNENKRLLEACDQLEKGNIEELGKLMYETHNGLSRDYGVSCKELDFLVDKVKGMEGVAGARMMGGGFGGCTINLVKEDAIPSLVKKIEKDYKAAMDIDLSYYIAQTGDGAGQIII